MEFRYKHWCGRGERGRTRAQPCRRYSAGCRTRTRPCFIKKCTKTRTGLRLYTLTIGPLVRFGPRFIAYLDWLSLCPLKAMPCLPRNCTFCMIFISIRPLHPSIALLFLTMHLRKHLSNIILWLGHSLNGVQIILRGLVFSIYYIKKIVFTNQYTSYLAI